MAYYNQFKGGKKDGSRQGSSWEEEGSRYRDENGAKVNRSASPRGDRRNAPRDYAPKPRADFVPRPAGDRSGAPRNDYAPKPRGGYAPKPRADFAPRPTGDRGGYAPKPRADFAPRPAGDRGGYAPKPHTDIAPAPRFGRPAEPPRREPEPLPENLLIGRNAIREALKSGRDIERMLVARGDLSGSARELYAMARERHVVIQEVDRARLDEITPHHQGMLAYASAYHYADVDDMFALAASRGEDVLLVILDGITDPQNLGAIIRTAACAGAHGIIVSQRHAVGLTPAAVKTSSGAVEYVPVARVTNLNRTIEELKTHGVWLYAADMNGENYTAADFNGPCALVIGSEGDGISRMTLDKCDHVVSLPMRPEMDSLNASVAAGVLLYAVRHSRGI